MTARLLFNDREISAAELERGGGRRGGGFDRLGIAEGDVVALMLRNEQAYFEAMLACRQLGAYYCPINWHFKAGEAGFILRDSGARALVANPDLLPQVEAGLPARVAVIAEWAGWRDAQSPWSGARRNPRGNLPYTSGTTGRPKGA